MGCLTLHGIMIKCPAAIRELHRVEARWTKKYFKKLWKPSTRPRSYAMLRLAVTDHFKMLLFISIILSLRPYALKCLKNKNACWSPPSMRSSYVTNKKHSRKDRYDRCKVVSVYDHTNPSAKSPIKEKNWRINISAFLRARVLTLERTLIYLQCWGG